MKFKNEAEFQKFQRDAKKHADALSTQTSYRRNQGQTQQAPAPSPAPQRKQSQPAQKPQNRPAQRSQSQPAGRGRFMGIIDAVKTKVTSAFDPKERQKREQEKARKEAAVIKKRNHFLPQIEKIAKKHGANVEALDTAAYVSKTVGNREKGVHINYGEPAATIERKLDTAFTKSALSSRVIKGVISGAHKAKEIREQLGEAGTAIKGAMGDGKGSMYEDPNFGGAFAGQSARAPPRKGKKKGGSGGSSGGGLYPDLNWG